MLSKKSSILYGLPMSGRTTLILQSISKIENIEIDQVLTNPDVLLINMENSIEDISYSIEFFSSAPSISLSTKYCIVKNIDFFSNEKQEIFLKCLEDSKTIFYFTAYSYHQIKTKALISRVSSYNITYENFGKNLSHIQKQILNSSKSRYPYKSMSQVNIWNFLSSSMESVLQLDDSFLNSKQNFLDSVCQIKQFPQWFVIDQTFLMISYSIQQKNISNSQLSNLLNKLIQNFSLADLSRIETLSLFLDSCYLVNKSFRSYFKQL